MEIKVEYTIFVVYSTFFTVTTMNNDDTRHEHPSYGQLSFSRVNGGADRFYGTEIRPNNYISMILQTSEMTKSLSRTAYYAKKKLVEVKMTPNQFAELLTNMNCEGVPVTISYVNGEQVESVPELDSAKTLTQAKFKKRMSDFSIGLKKSYDEANKLIDKKTLSKDDQTNLKRILYSAIQEIQNNIPYFSESFKEVMDKVVVEAKSEIDAAMTHQIMTLGLQAMHDQLQNNLLNSEE